MANSTLRFALRVCLPLVAVGLLVLLVGWFWFGWGHKAANNDLLDSLPVPPGAQRIEVHPHAYEFDESLITPPDGWAILAKYSAPPSASREDVVDFYISRLSPTWEFCIDADFIIVANGEEITYMGNVQFGRQNAFVSVDTKNMNVASRAKTFDVYVDHDSHLRVDCYGK